jgi:hypothetical protein
MVEGVRIDAVNQPKGGPRWADMVDLMLVLGRNRTKSDATLYFY